MDTSQNSSHRYFETNGIKEPYANLICSLYTSPLVPKISKILNI